MAAPSTPYPLTTLKTRPNTVYAPAPATPEPDRIITPVPPTLAVSKARTTSDSTQDAIFRGQWVYDEKLVTTVQAPFPNLLTIRPDWSIPYRKLYTYLFPVATGAGDFAFLGEMVFWFHDSALFSIPFSSGQLNVTGLNQSVMLPGTATTTPTRDALSLTTSGPNLSGEPTNPALVPFTLKLTCDRISVNLIRAFNLASYRAVIACLSDETF